MIGAMLGKLIEIDLKNIGKIQNIKEAINKPLTIFYGDIKQGKSTILKAFVWGCGGPFPSDILRHGSRYGHIKSTFENGIIQREFYIGKDETTKAREVVCIINNKPVSVLDLKKILNPFLLNQNFYSDKSGLEKKRYFTELFGIDTAREDSIIKCTDKKASTLRQKIKFYGDINTTEVKPVDIEEVEAYKYDAIFDYRKNVESRKSENKAIKNSNKIVAEKETSIIQDRESVNNNNQEITLLEQKIKRLKDVNNIIDNAIIDKEIWLKADENQVKEILPDIEYPDTTSLDNEINAGVKANLEYEQYKDRIHLQGLKENDLFDLKKLELKSRTAKKQKLDKLKVYSDKCPIPGLVFGDEITFEGTSIDQMISNSQEMRLGSLLKSMYPANIGLELIDRGESFGKKKIFEFVKKAQDDESTILVTFVSETPAKVPDDVGVFVDSFVIEDGEVKNEMSDPKKKYDE